MAILTVVILFVKNKSDQALSTALNSGVKGSSSPRFPFEDTTASKYPPICSSVKIMLCIWHNGQPINGVVLRN